MWNIEIRDHTVRYTSVAINMFFLDPHLSYFDLYVRPAPKRIFRNFYENFGGIGHFLKISLSHCASVRWFVLCRKINLLLILEFDDEINFRIQVGFRSLTPHSLKGVKKKAHSIVVFPATRLHRGNVNSQLPPSTANSSSLTSNLPPPPLYNLPTTPILH